ncbi:hypothetical protein [Streptacidiphilus monticola]|uniref:SMI1/KNR4 family protein n=1 Tax=Streptacidiphilus monticola TaxID=2161674 RepID=A0ABW1G3S0_9ACTN
MDAVLAELGPPPFNSADQAIWTEWERQGMIFPESFRAFVDAYGTGDLADFLTFYHPAATDPARSLLELINAAPDDDADMIEDGTLPHRYYPEPDGLLIWGTSSEGDRFSFRWINEDQYVIGVLLRQEFEYVELADDFDSMVMKAIRRENPWPWVDWFSGDPNWSFKMWRPRLPADGAQ